MPPVCSDESSAHGKPQSPLLPFASWTLRLCRLSCGAGTLCCSMWALVPQAGIEPGSPALGARSLSHKMSRKFGGEFERTCPGK